MFAHWDACTPSERTSLLAQLRALDVARAVRIFSRAVADHRSGVSSSGAIEPVDVDGSVLTATPATIERWRRVGLTAASKGELAVVLLAGGQGTRLGSADPKGMVDLGLPSGRTLFRMQAERLLKLGALAAEAAGGKNKNENKPERAAGVKPASIPWYVMTSPHTHAPTVRYFEDNAYFGLDAADVTFFQQGSLPCFDDDGKIIMKSRSEVATAPDGNGGLYAALHAAGCLSDMKRRGVRHVYAYCVDNALVQVGDPVYVGFCAARGADAGAKVIAKAYPTEPVGVFTRRDGNVHVVEYSELPPELATATDPASGKLRLNAANIVLHYYALDFLERCCDPDGNVQASLVYHVAHKKVPHVSRDGQSTVAPDSPNGIKLEAFIFDVYAFAREVAFLEGERAADFAPVKNKEGTGKDSPDTARALLSALHARWIKAAGGLVDGGSPGGLVEVTAAVSYAGENLAPLVEGVTVPAGTVIDEAWAARGGGEGRKGEGSAAADKTTRRTGGGRKRAAVEGAAREPTPPGEARVTRSRR